MSKKRAIQNNEIKDVGSLTNEQYNRAAGAQKQIDVGPKLVAFPNATTGTTDVSAGAAMPQFGRSVAVFNSDTAVGALAFGQATIAVAPVAGTVAADGTVGIPCAPGTWTYLSAGDANFIRSSSNKLFVFLIEDDTYLVQQTTR